MDFLGICLVIRTIETRLVPYSTRNIDLPVPDFGFGTIESNTSVNAAAATEKNDTNETNGTNKRKAKHLGEHIVAKRDDEIRGHTAFLTFAAKFFY